MKVKLNFCPHEGQKEILKLYDDSTTKILTVACSRRFGKSYLCKYIAVRDCLQIPNTKYLYCCQNYKLCLEFYGDFERLLKKTGLVSSFNKGEFKIEFINGSYIEFFSAHNHDSIRGKKFTRGTLDEAALYSREAFEASIMPCFATEKNAKIIIASTPRSQRGVFYDYFKMNYKGFKRYKASYDKNPYIDLDYIELQRKSISDIRFRQEFLAEFIANGETGIFKNTRKCINNNPDETPQYYCAIDTGYTDYTVLSIMNEKGQQVFIKGWSEIDFTELAPIITNEIKKWNIKSGYMEVNGIGKPFYHMIRKDCPQIREWTTNNANKVDMIETLMLAFQQEVVNILEDDELLIELDNYEVQSTSSGKTTFNAASEFHDDYVIATALSYKAMQDGTKVGVYDYVKVSKKNKRR